MAAARVTACHCLSSLSSPSPPPLLSTLPHRHRCSCCRLCCHRCLLLPAAAYLIVILCACRRHCVTAAITSVAIRQFPPPLPYQSCRRCRSRATAAIVRSLPPAAPSHSCRRCHHCAAAAVTSPAAHASPVPDPPIWACSSHHFPMSCALGLLRTNR